MKKIIISISLISIFIFSDIICAHERLDYVGIELVYGKTGYKEDYGAELLSGSRGGGVNFFVGHYFCNWFGIEIGYQKFSNKFREAEILDNTRQFGIDKFSGLSDDVYNTKTSMHNMNINLISKFSLNRNVSVIPFVGIAYVKARIELDLLSRDVDKPAAPSDKAMLDFDCTKFKLVPRIGIRGEYLFTKNFGSRISYIWENTSAINLRTIRENIVPRRTLTAKLKNSSIFSIGFFYNFNF